MGDEGEEDVMGSRVSLTILLLLEEEPMIAKLCDLGGVEKDTSSFPLPFPAPAPPPISSEDNRWCCLFDVREKIGPDNEKDG